MNYIDEYRDRDIVRGLAAQIVELTEQIRGSAGDRQVAEVDIGLAANEGGWLVDDVAAAAVHIIAREPAPG